MEQPFPKYALFSGKLHAFSKRVEPIPETNCQAIVICRSSNDDGDPDEDRYVEESVWLDAAHDFKRTARKAGLVTSQSSAQEKIALFRAAAKSHGLQAGVERSRSGNGGHIWFFFERPISAKLARDFGSASS